MTLSFRKMHGLGNDFVVMDARAQPFTRTSGLIQTLSDRRFGIGCDQLIVIEAPHNQSADAFMVIYNPDGTEAGACGNATRCVAALLMRETGKTQVVIETISGLLPAMQHGLQVTVDMGAPRLDWSQIPLHSEMDTLALPLEIGPLKNPVAVSMGNPHAVFFVADVCAIDLPRWGAQVESHPFFPAKTNVGVVQVIDRETLRMRVWERGAGITLACGSGACAALVAAVRCGLTERKATIQLEGGNLQIEWKAETNRVLMTGGWVEAFKGEWIS